MDRRSEEPRFLRPWFSTLQTCEEYLFLRKLIRFSPVPNSVQYDIPAKDVITQPVVSRPDAPLSLSRFQARQLFDILLSHNPNVFESRCPVGHRLDAGLAHPRRPVVTRVRPPGPLPRPP